jgi:hypothetical protein
MADAGRHSPPLLAEHLGDFHVLLPDVRLAQLTAQGLAPEQEG